MPTERIMMRSHQHTWKRPFRCPHVRTLVSGVTEVTEWCWCDAYRFITKTVYMVLLRDQVLEHRIANDADLAYYESVLDGTARIED